MSDLSESSSRNKRFYKYLIDRWLHQPYKNLYSIGSVVLFQLSVTETKFSVWRKLRQDAQQKFSKLYIAFCQDIYFSRSNHNIKIWNKGNPVIKAAAVKLENETIYNHRNKKLSIYDFSGVKGQVYLTFLTRRRTATMWPWRNLFPYKWVQRLYRENRELR